MLIILFLLVGMFFCVLEESLMFLLLSLTVMLGMLHLGNLGEGLNLEIWGLGVDVFSYGMMVLSLFIGGLMLVGESNKGGRLSDMFKILILSVILCLYSCFFVCNFMIFYLFFEVVLAPMFLLIFYYGNQPERLESGVYMLFYTVFGSLPLLVGFLMMWNFGSLNMFYVIVNKVDFLVVWEWMFLLAFLIKLPVYGMHIWLPKAHVEAPVSGSMVLAGILLKLGCYGLIRLMPYLKEGYLMKSFLISLGLWGSLLSGCLCLRQLDMKKLVAYSSVVHMGLYLGGVVGGSDVGVSGGMIVSIGHGLCSSGLFFFVNLLYIRSSTRSLLLSKGMSTLAPSLMLWGFLLSVANMAAPPFSNIFGEIMLGVGVLWYDLIFSSLLLLLYLVTVVYGIYFYSVVSHGKVIEILFKSVSVSDFLVLFMHFIPVLLVVFVIKGVIG